MVARSHLQKSMRLRDCTPEALEERLHVRQQKCRADEEPFRLIGIRGVWQYRLDGLLARLKNRVRVAADIALFYARLNQKDQPSHGWQKAMEGPSILFNYLIADAASIIFDRITFRGVGQKSSLKP